MFQCCSSAVGAVSERSCPLPDRAAENRCAPQHVYPAPSTAHSRQCTATVLGLATCEVQKSQDTVKVYIPHVAYTRVVCLVYPGRDLNSATTVLARQALWTRPANDVALRPFHSSAFTVLNRYLCSVPLTAVRLHSASTANATATAWISHCSTERSKVLMKDAPNIQ